MLIISTFSNPQESKNLSFARRTRAFAEIIRQLNRVHNGKRVDWSNQKIWEVVLLTTRTFIQTKKILEGFRIARSSITGNPNERIAWLGTIKFLRMTFKLSLSIIRDSNCVNHETKKFFMSTTSTSVTEMMPRTTTNKRAHQHFSQKHKRRCKDISEEEFAT